MFTEQLTKTFFKGMKKKTCWVNGFNKLITVELFKRDSDIWVFEIFATCLVDPVHFCVVFSERDADKRCLM